MTGPDDDRSEHDEARLADARIRTILESITDGFFSLDRAWRFDYVNAEGERILGRAPGALLGQVIWEAFPGVVGTTFEETYRRVARERQPGSFLSWYPDHGAWYDVRAFPSATGISVFFRDVTEARRIEDALRASEERRRLALDSAELGAWNIDPAQQRLTTDERFCQIFSGATAPMGYAQAVAAVHADDRAGVGAAIAAATRPSDPRPYAIEYRVVHPGGSVHWVFAKGRANFEGQGAERRLASFDGTVADITERKLANERLRLSESRFRTLFESIDEGFCVIEMLFDAAGTAHDYRILEANPAYERHTGLVGTVGKTVREFAPKMDPVFFENYGRVAVTGEPIRFVSESKALQRWYDIYAFRLGDAAERKVAVLFNDISARRRAEEDLRQVAADLSEADRRKDEFLATLAHELRNPLAPISHSLEILRLAKDNEAMRERAQRVMERQVRQMARLVDDLLDVSRISSDKLELRRQRTSLAAIVASAVETSKPLLDGNGVHVTVTLPDEPVDLDADLTRLAQVFLNLLNNAAKFTDPGGAVTLAARCDGDEVVVSVKDTGIGIAEGQLQRIFDMFSQVGSSLERSHGGLGIGLTLVRRLVELHGGRVEARSEGLGHGSEFIVRLPVMAAATEAVPADEAEAAARPRGFKVLVVDDNQDAATSLAALLEMTGHETRVVHDGLAAVEAAAAWPVDLVLLDIGLPGLNGYEVAQRIRARPGGERVALCALTGWGQDADRRRSREAGFDHHLVKPVDPPMLYRLLAGLVVAPR